MESIKGLIIFKEQMLLTNKLSKSKLTSKIKSHHQKLMNRLTNSDNNRDKSTPMETEFDENHTTKMQMKQTNVGMVIRFSLIYSLVCAVGV